MMDAAIQTEGLSKRYRRTAALSGVSLSVPRGSIFALVGANGAGKTTFIKLLMNILTPTSGEATVLGVASTRVAGAIFERIGYVSENQELPESMTVKWFLTYMRGFYPQWDRVLEQQLIGEFGLPLGRKLKDLSRGMKMKAVLVSVLAYRPALIVLDEPFSGLDPLVRDEFIQSLLGRSVETTVLISSHDLNEIESLASHVGYLEGGKLLFSEEMSVLRDRFREIEVRFAEAPGDLVELTVGPPGEWLELQLRGTAFRFVDSRFGEGTRALLEARFPDAVAIEIAAMPLRAIFLAIARAGRAPVEMPAEIGVAQ